MSSPMPNSPVKPIHSTSRINSGIGRTMNIRGIGICLLALSLPQQLAATSIDFSSIAFAPGRPMLSDSIADAVQDRTLLEEAIAHNLQLIRRVPYIKYQVAGYTDGKECTGSGCHDLALRRARLFQAALMASGAPVHIFCHPAAMDRPWPSSYVPSADELVIGRQATLQPVFDGCA